MCLHHSSVEPARPLDRLRPFGQQAHLFHDLPEHELDRLAESMRQKGLIHPIEVTSDDRIIDGHQRVQAARKLGWTEITVWVRDDLDGDELAVRQRHIDANRDRRQLDPLDQARLAKELMEIERARRGGRSHGDGDVRERVGEQLNRSGRHVDRLLAVLRTPMEIQKAVSEGNLTLVAAAKVDGLEESIQQKIVAAIHAGATPAEAVAEYLPGSGSTKVPASKEADHFLRAAEAFLRRFEGQEKKVYFSGLNNQPQIEVLERLVSAIRKILPVLKARDRSWEKYKAKQARDFAKGMAKAGAKAKKWRF